MLDRRSIGGGLQGILARSQVDMRKELRRTLQMHARLQPLCVSRVCGAPFPVTAAMFVDGRFRIPAAAGARRC